MNVGEIIMTVRERTGMTRTELANELGVRYHTLDQWETGRACPSADSLIKVCRATGHEVVIQKTYDGGYLKKRWT